MVSDEDRKFFHENGMTAMHEYYYDDSPSPELDDLRYHAEILEQSPTPRITKIIRKNLQAMQYFMGVSIQ